MRYTQQLIQSFESIHGPHLLNAAHKLQCGFFWMVGENDTTTTLEFDDWKVKFVFQYFDDSNNVV